ncbi:hypothetical protein [Planctomycetes bacterium K23_9]|uniref:Uncharacterized protein n=1 Tax=Stieleria marina TaxID=1930275 RepID=A0A517NSF1_9BACT|nr:hypothetical protein K239x_19880 [Planctomycetes bacterium K23_9]
MFRNIAHYFLALVVLSSCALMYDSFSKRWLLPPVVETVEIVDHKPQNNDDLGDIFPDGAWQRGLCKKLKTADGELLFQHWEQIADDQWKLWPITLVVGRGTTDQPNPEPIILEAAEGAEIRFTESLDMMSGGAPPIERGRMMGIVEIRRPTVDPNKSPLLIRTSNVGIDNRKVWTTEPIRLEMGETRMVGRDLTLHLAASAGSDQGGSGAAAILDRMELIYLDEFIIPLEKNSLAKSQQKQFDLPAPLPAIEGEKELTRLADFGSVPETAVVTKEAAAFVKLNCDGRVEYDFALDLLSLREHVSLQHHVPGVADDQFECESLELSFREPENRNLPRVSALDWLSKIDAQGTPAVIDLPSLDCRITADRIELDALGGLLRASGGKGVEIRRGTLSAQLSQLSYQYNPETPGAIGTIDTFGWGIVNVLDPELPVRQFRWSDSFKLQPIGTPLPGKLDNDLSIQVSGDVQARFTDGGDFRSDAIDGVLRAVTVPSDASSLGVAGATSESKQTIRPDRFQAIGNVHLNNAAVNAKTQRLVLFFVDEPNPEVITEPNGQTDPAPNSPLRQWVAQPTDQDQPKQPVARKIPKVTGDEIAAKLRMNESGVSVKDLSVAGNVELIHSIEAGGQTLPAELTGSELLLTSEAGKDVLQLGSRPGVPSEFKLGDGYFIGPQINIWPSDNIVRIEGAGQFQMPSAILPQSLSGDRPDKVRWTKPPNCKWNGEMIFDGKTAVLTDGVDITAELVNQGKPWSIHMIGDRLELVLLENIEFGEAQSLRGASIQQVTLLQSEDQPVLVQAEQFAADGVREARHVMQAPRLMLLPGGGGKLIGAGPGWYRSWMYADAKGPLSPSDAKTQANAGSTKSRSLMGVHLVYHQAMQGDLANRSLSFLRGVRVGVKQVVDWQDTFDAHQMDSISDGESTVDCDTLQLTVAPGMENRPNIPGISTPWEMKAQDGVVFRSRSEQGLLEGTAARAVYSSLKDLFTLEGAPSRGAVIRKTEANGKTGPNMTVRKMTIRPKTLEIVDMVLERFSAGNLPQRENR